MEFHQLFNVNPGHPEAEDHLVEDLLQVRNTALDLLIDVGWYGPLNGEDAGSFRAELFRGDFHGAQVASFASRSLEEVIAKVQQWLTQR